jgi:hypothetical protein
VKINKKRMPYKNYKEYIEDNIVLIFILNLLFLVDTYKATRFELKFWTFVYIITLIGFDFILLVLPYKLKKWRNSDEV